MKNNLEVSSFLDGTVAIEVSTDEQSRYLIKLSKDNGFDVGVEKDAIEIDTYKKYPYYFIEDNWQLQASETLDNALYNCEYAETFEVWFGETK